MGRHVDHLGVSSGAFETVDAAVVTVQEITDTMWTLASAAATDAEASEALLDLAKYLRVILHDSKEGDPELVAYGLMEWCHEIEQSDDEAAVRRPAGWIKWFSSLMRPRLE